MQFTALAILSLALAVAQAMPSPNGASQLGKRSGSISVTTWSGSDCDVGNEGTTTVGTSGVCVNMQDAASFSFHDSDSDNCNTIEAVYYAGTGCGGDSVHTSDYTHGTCNQPYSTHGSARMTCIA